MTAPHHTLLEPDVSLADAPLADIVPLIDLLAQEKPILTGLWISPEVQPVTLPGDWQCVPPTDLLGLPFVQRHDLAVLDLRGPPPADWVQGLTRLRDLLARRVLVVAPDTQAQPLRALGFGQFGQLGHLQVWQFNILAYKQVPDWLNARYWANPENFGKYRW